MIEKFNARNDQILLIGFILAVIFGPIVLAPFGAGYPDLLQKFAIYGIFAIGFNILFGLTGYLSFGPLSWVLALMRPFGRSSFCR